MSTYFFLGDKTEPGGPSPAGFSRVVIRLAKGRGAKPNANTRKLSPDKCLVVPSLSPRLRPGCPRNIGDNAVTTRSLQEFATNCLRLESGRGTLFLLSLK